jgi:hypothetical protein
MNTIEKLLTDLTNDSAETRLDAVRVIGMVEETFALKMLAQQFRRETDPTVKEALDWAGQRVLAAQKNGYSTFDAIYRYFGVYRHIENMQDPTEAELEKQLQTNLEIEMMKMRSQAQRGQMAGAALAGGMLALGAMTGGIGAIGAMGLMAGSMPSTFETSSNMRATQEVISATRTPAPRPSDSNINVWVKRLLEGQTPEARLKAPKELVMLNNPAALVPLAIAYTTDPDEKVREEVLHSGRKLYWGIIYFEIEQTGLIHEEMSRLAQSVGKVYLPPKD